MDGTMELPHAKVIAPTPPATDLASVPAHVQLLAVTKKTRNLERLGEFPALAHVWASGLRNEHIALLPASLRVLALYDFHAPDLSTIGRFTRLESLVVWYAPRLRSLRGVETLSALEELIVGDVRGPIELDAVSALQKLHTLSIEGGMHRPLQTPTLRPLSALHGIRRLRLASLKVDDGSLEPLREMHGLEELFIANQFTLEQFAALAQALPDAPGDSLSPTRDGHWSCSRCGGNSVLLTGGRGGFRCLTCDTAAIAKHVARFEAAPER